MRSPALFDCCRHYLLLAALALALPAWAGDDSPFYAQDITDKGYGTDFHLTDHNGRERTLADFHGRVVIIFFGYTQCPDFCPTTLAKMAAVMKRLGAIASKVQVLFITIDPQRDSETLLRNYVPRFNPTFLGLRGSPKDTEGVTQAFQAHYQIVKYQGQILIDHTAYGYLIDSHGKTRLLLPYTMTPQQITEDILTILDLDGATDGAGSPL